MDETEVNLLDKPLNDLTLRDTVKINIIVIAAVVAIPVAIMAVVSLKDAVRTRIRGRKTETPETIIVDKTTE